MATQQQNIGEVLQFFNEARRPVKSSDRVPGPFPYLGASGTVDYVEGFTHEGSYLCVSEDGANLLTRSLPIAWVQDGKFWANNHLQVLGGVSREHLTFFRYAIESTNIAAYVTGSAQPKLSKASLSSVKVPKFSRGEEERIGKLLSAIDDKITANVRVLEAANELVKNLYTAIPKSSNHAIESIGELVKKNVKPEEMDDSKALINLEHFDSKQIWISRHAQVPEATSAKSSFLVGDVLFGKLRPYFHKVGVAPIGGYCSTDVLVVRPREDSYRGLLLAAMSAEETVAIATQNSNGTRMPRAKWTDIASCAIPDPDDPKSTELGKLMDVLIPKCNALIHENHVLARTRDELLPLLMSGRITVGEAEDVAGTAASES